jgi:hypothetical protein
MVVGRPGENQQVLLVSLLNPPQNADVAYGLPISLSEASDL